MSRVSMATQPWGVFWDPAGNVQSGLSVLIKKRDGTNATHYSARTAGTSTTGSITTDVNGRLTRFIDPGEYTLTVNSVTYDIEAVSGSIAVISEAGINPHEAAYGAVGDNVANDTAAIQAAIAALPVFGGRKTGRIWFQPGKRYRINGLLNLDDTSGVTLECPGGGVSADAGRPMLEWFGAAGSGPMIRGASSYGLHLRNLSLVASDVAYNGDLVALGRSASAIDTFYPIFERCYFAGIGSSILARSLLALDGSIGAVVRECQFIDAVVGIRGKDTLSVNGTSIRTNGFDRLSTAGIYNPGEGWDISGGNFFSPRADGSPRGIRGDVADGGGTIPLGVSITGNWFGDVSGGAVGAHIDLCGRGIFIAGNRIEIESTGIAHIAIILRNVIGGSITANRFSAGGATAIGIDFQQRSSQKCDGVEVRANQFTAITPITNEANLTSGEYRNNIGLADKHVPGSATVASAATIAVPAGVDFVSVTGTTTITSVTAGTAGQRVTLVFAGILTLTDGSNLKLAGNFVTTADDAINLICDGTNWIETSRSVN